MREGVDGLLPEKTRPPGKTPVAPDRVAEIVRLTLEPPPFEGHPLNAAGDSEGGRPGGFDRAGYLEGAWPQPAPLAALQALQRPGVCREAHRHCRLVCRSAGLHGGAVGR